MAGKFGHKDFAPVNPVSLRETAEAAKQALNSLIDLVLEIHQQNNILRLELEENEAAITESELPTLISEMQTALRKDEFGLRFDIALIVVNLQGRIDRADHDTNHKR